MVAFQRRQEDFVCEHCKTAVHGNGYTNHCPECLWSKHVDVDPGDRLSACGGMMKPTGIEGTVTKYTLTHSCIVCGHTKHNVAQAYDASGALVALAQFQANTYMRKI